MARPSNPRLMARVLEVVTHLGEGKGSSAKQVLEVLRQGNKPPTRNLAMQVRRALKNAVTAGLLQLRSGRYKMLISLQSALKNRAGAGGVSSGDKTSVKNPARKKKEDVEDVEDSGNLQSVERGPKSRCSHCKKHKRKLSRRRRKRSSKRRRRPTKQSTERKSRKLRRRGGDEEVSTRRDRRRKMASPGARSQGEVPNGQRSERPGKTDPETNEDDEIRESAGSRRGRSDSSSGSDREEEGPNTAKAKLISGGRKTGTSSRRSASKPRRSSRKRNDNIAENDSEEANCRMECCDEDEHRGQELADEDSKACCEHNAGSGTSI